MEFFRLVHFVWNLMHYMRSYGTSFLIVSDFFKSNFSWYIKMQKISLVRVCSYGRFLKILVLILFRESNSTEATEQKLNISTIPYLNTEMLVQFCSADYGEFFYETLKRVELRIRRDFHSDRIVWVKFLIFPCVSPESVYPSKNGQKHEECPNFSNMASIFKQKTSMQTTLKFKNAPMIFFQNQNLPMKFGLEI